MLLVAGGFDLERILRALRPAGYLVEVEPGASGALDRLGRAPPIDILVVNGVDELQRARLLVVAAERNVWCVYLRSASASTELPPPQRAKLIAAVPLDADGARIASTIRALVAARRAKTAG